MKYDKKLENRLIKKINSKYNLTKISNNFRDVINRIVKEVVFLKTEETDPFFQFLTSVSLEYLTKKPFEELPNVPRNDLVILNKMRKDMYEI